MTVVAYEHIPVLVEEVVGQFDFGRPARILDGTLGLGGHARALLSRYPELRVLGLEWDPAALAIARERLSAFEGRVEIQEASYADAAAALGAKGWDGVDGLLLDLGLSSLQLADSSRGFSFLKPGPLDMRMSSRLTRTAWDLLTHQDEGSLARLFQRYGEEPMARRIASELKRRLEHGTLPNDAWAIAGVIRGVYGRVGRTDPATRCFQALRIAVNGELDHLATILQALPQLLANGGRAVILSFHSLEDRLVKQAFHSAAHPCTCPPKSPVCQCGLVPWGRVVTRKAIQASETEQRANPRSRSVRLRVLERLPR